MSLLCYCWPRSGVSKKTREKNCSHLGLWLLFHGLFVAWWLFHWGRGNRERRWRTSKERCVLLLL